MVGISKNKQPNSLVAYKLSAGSQYDGVGFAPVKNDIRRSLLSEQYYLCAYCMSRIYYHATATCKPLDDNRRYATKIEHWHCQDSHPAEALNYDNMLVVCCGNEGQEPKSQHYDTKKGNSKLKYNPSNPSHRIESKIKYLANGKISSDDAEFDRQLNDVLNLNFGRLPNNRKAMIAAVEDALGRKYGKRTKAEIQKLLDKWQAVDENGYKKEYFGVAVYILNKKLQSCTQ